jgi:phosphatidate cytidylyltransferase
MAFNRRTFLTRASTAIVFVIVMVAGLIINSWSFFILFSIIHFGCWWEYQQLVQKIDPGYQEINAVHKYGIMIAGWAIMIGFASDWLPIQGIVLKGIGWWLALDIFIVILINDLLIVKQSRPKNLGHSIFGLIYISLSWGLMVDLYAFPFLTEIGIVTINYQIPILIIASIWINDTMAYIVGSLIGKHSLSKISPGKTWEGTIGGILITIIIVPLISYLLTGFFSMTVIIVAGISAIAGTFGDLLESKLKRLAGVKDSGSIMPGHGGFLDRFDSLLLATPFVWLFVKVIAR